MAGYGKYWLNESFLSALFRAYSARYSEEQMIDCIMLLTEYKFERSCLNVKICQAELE